MSNHDQISRMQPTVSSEKHWNSPRPPETCSCHLWHYKQRETWRLNREEGSALNKHYVLLVLNKHFRWQIESPAPNMFEMAYRNVFCDASDISTEPERRTCTFRY